ncbi:MAG: hypothetical protein U1E65_33335 [Myxococcota bacterium]
MAEFNIDRFAELSGRVELDDLDWEKCRQVGITDAEARVIRYMADTETHTILYMRDLLAGHSAADPEITSFLSIWVYEELWHGRALDRLLTVCGHPPAPDHYKKATKNAHIRESIEASLSHFAASLTPRFICVNMAWGALNELTAGAAYKAVERRTQNPVLAELLKRIVRQERKHFSFYYKQAETRMTGDVWAQRLVTLALKRFWTIVGSGVGGDDNLGFIAALLFDDQEGISSLVDAQNTIRELPGLGWFELLTAQVAAQAAGYKKRHGPVSYGLPSGWVPPVNASPEARA